jgi:hypothetical protein
MRITEVGSQRKSFGRELKSKTISLVVDVENIIIEIARNI